LTEISPRNAETLKSIASALAVVSLDSDAVNTIDRLLNNSLHGLGSSRNTGNRWFDKTYNIAIGREGEGSVVFEHTIADGLPFLHVGVLPLSHH
jgi:carnitine O-acetyltransferase